MLHQPQETTSPPYSKEKTQIRPTSLMLEATTTRNVTAGTNMITTKRGLQHKMHTSPMRILFAVTYETTTPRTHTVLSPTPNLT